MDCFIKKIFVGKIDEKVHKQFVRFGKGLYEKRAVLVLSKGNKVKVKGSFEYANDFVLLVAELINAEFSGIIMSKESLNLDNEKKKAGLYFYEVEDINSEKIKEIAYKVYFMLLDCEVQEVKLKIKKKLPKPGKSGDLKIDERFCQLEADLKFWPVIRGALFWDLPLEIKKARVEHTYKIKNLILPQDERDFELMRIKAKRKGLLIRKLEICGKQEVKEREFEV